MKILHNGGFSDGDRAFYKEIIFSNTIQSMRTILEAMLDLSIELAPENYDYREHILRSPANIHADSLPKDTFLALDTLRRDPGVEEAIIRNNEFQLNDSAT
jgi:guanine nucleotide-binding protein G(i) subunit alpha